MNPFRTHAEQDLSEGDLNDLIAFHLHELSPEREAAVRRAIETEPALASESASIAFTLDAVKDVPMQIDDAVLDRNWKALRPSLRTYVRPFAGARRWSWSGRWNWPVFAGAVAACAAVLAFFLMPLLSSRSADKRAVASTQSFHPSDLPSPEGQPADTQRIGNKMTGGSAILAAPGAYPSFKAHLRTGLFRSNGNRPDYPIHLLSLARTTELSQPALRLTPSAAPIFSVPPVTSSSGIPEQAGDLIAETAQPDGEKRSNPGGLIKRHRDHSVDVMLGMGGIFVVPRSGQTATSGVTAMGALHQQFRPALGYRITASYSRPDFSYNYPGYPSGYGTVEINSRIYEVAGTYVVEGPRRGRWKTSVDAGAGLLAFLPAVAAESTRSVFRAAGVAGVNLDVALTKHWGARVAYRAQVFRGPNFVYADNGAPVTSSVTVSNEPALGVTYNFGKN